MYLHQNIYPILEVSNTPGISTNNCFYSQGLLLNIHCSVKGLLCYFCSLQHSRQHCLFFHLMLKVTRHEVFGCPWRTRCERRIRALISFMCIKGSSHTQSLSEPGFKLLASLDIFRWRFQRKCWCALALGSLWILLSMHLQTWEFISIILQRTPLFQPTWSVVFSSCTGLSKCFTKTQCHF